MTRNEGSMMPRAILNTPVQEAQVRVLQLTSRNSLSQKWGCPSSPSPPTPHFCRLRTLQILTCSYALVYVFSSHSTCTGGGAPFSTMQAEEIFRQFFGDFDLGSMFGNQGFGGGASSTHQVSQCFCNSQWSFHLSIPYSCLFSLPPVP